MTLYFFTCIKGWVLFYIRKTSKISNPKPFNYIF